jgi:NAD(P)H-dependent FMN reductase
MSTSSASAGQAKPRLLVILVSARPGRLGAPIADWVIEAAKAEGTFEPVLADLAEINLPAYNEPNKPFTGVYMYDYTKAWSALVDSADAFVVVMAEYNHGFPGALKNAVDYLSKEWARKPLAFVSYGGIAGGTRAVEAFLPIATFLKMTPTNANVILPFAEGDLTDEGAFEPPERTASSAVAMLRELDDLRKLLAPARQ